MAFPKHVFSEIMNWRQEGWDEATDKYFFPMPEAASLISGERSFVISRKGTGKSALAKHLLLDEGHQRYASKLSLDDFPYEEFRRDMDNPEQQPSQRFDVGWQYVIYCEIAFLMMRNPSLRWSTRDRIRQVFEEKTLGAISNIRRWTSPDFWMDLVEAGLKIDLLKGRVPTIRQKRDAVRELVLRNLDDSLYMALFDGLDAGYAKLPPDRHTEYVHILSSLFSAIRAIRTELNSQRERRKVRLVVFLRDDIYDRISDANREKLRDDALSLKWDEPRLKRLLAFRIAVAAGKKSDAQFQEVWSELCGQLEFTPKQKKWDKFDFISSYTFRRPRDYIYYLSRCCAKALERAEGKNHPLVIGGDVLQQSAADFSRHLRREIEDEIGGEFSDISKVLDVFEKMEKRVFTKAEFEQQYVTSYPGVSDAQPAGQVLNKLFQYSVVGNVTPGGQDFFRYMATEETRFRQFEEALKGKGKLVIHRGLIRDLGLH